MTKYQPPIKDYMFLMYDLFQINHPYSSMNDDGSPTKKCSGKSGRLHYFRDRTSWILDKPIHVHYPHAYV